MKAYTEKLYRILLSELDKLNEQYDPQNLSDGRLGLIIATIDQIQEKLKTRQFKNEADEVYFFKFVFPPVLALFIYYSDKIEWDRIIRQGSPECRYKFIDRIYSQAETFRKENSVFCNYSRDGKKELDHLYFFRNSPVNREIKYEIGRIIDPSSPPLHCILLATLIAYSKMEHEVGVYIRETNETIPRVKTGKSKLRWTGKQIDLIELGYGLKETGSLNDGNASLKEIFEFLSDVFEIELGNTSRLFQDIMTRKTGQTVFIDLMKAKLLQRIEDVLN
jgi:hypothetical protein